MKQFIFMCGTPRSGTTYLANIIGLHPEITLGVERFKHHYPRRSLLPDLFEKSRFFDLRAEDTGASERLVLPNRKELEDKYDRCTFVGDKYPNIVRHIDWINDRFGNPAFLFVLRDPVAVGRSWSVRAENKKDHWPEKNDFAAGLMYWVDSLKRAVLAKSTGKKIVVMDYDLLTSMSGPTAAAHLDRIFGQLGVASSEAALSALLATRRRGDAPATDYSGDELKAATTAVESKPWLAFMREFARDQFETPAWATRLA